MTLQDRSILAIQCLLIELEGCAELLNQRSAYRRFTRDDTIAYAKRVIREYEGRE